MATIPQLWYDIRTALQAALVVNSVVLVQPANIFVNNPPPNALSALAKPGAPPIVSIFDLRMARNATRYAPQQLTPTQVDPTLVSTVSNQMLFAGTSQTITMSGPVGIGDAVSAYIQTGLGAFNTSATAQDGLQTPTTMAAALAASVNASSALIPFITATNAGPIVTISNISNQNLRLYSAVGNVGAQIVEQGRQIRPIQIVLYTATELQREQIAPVILTWINQIQSIGASITHADGCTTRVTYNSDMASRNDQPPNIFRWFFVIDCEFSITSEAALASLLGFSLIKEVGY